MSNLSRKRRAVEISDSSSTIAVVEASAAAALSDDVAAAVATSVVGDEEEEVVKVSVPRGRNASGRAWKPSTSQKKSAMFKGNLALRTFAERQKLRQEALVFKAKIDAIKRDAAAEKEAEKAKRDEKRKRKEENEKKNEVHQVITNVHKIRKMTKKQARSIVKVL